MCVCACVWCVCACVCVRKPSKPKRVVIMLISDVLHTDCVSVVACWCGEKGAGGGGGGVRLSACACMCVCLARPR